MKDFEASSLKYFGFLADDYGYQAIGVKKPRHGHEPKGVRRFQKDNLTVIVVSEHFDHPHNHWCVYFHKEMGWESCMFSSNVEHSIWTILENKNVSFTRLNSKAIKGKNLTEEMMMASLAHQVKTYAGEVVQGDFSVFGEQVFAITQLFETRRGDGSPFLDNQLWGVFSNLDKVREEIARLKTRPDYSDQSTHKKSRGFHIQALKIDKSFMEE